MNIKEFWQNQKDEKKRQKQLAKENKKRARTPEQKLTRILSIIFIIFIIIGATYSCSTVFSGNSDTDSDSGLFSISKETKDALQEPVDTNLLFLNGRYSKEDKDKCFEKLKNSGNKEIMSLSDIDEMYKLKIDTTLDKYELRGLVGNLLSEGENIVLCDFVIYSENGGYFEKSIVYLKFDDLTYFGVEGIYITTISNIEVLDDSIVALDSNAIINRLDNEKNDKVIKELNEYMELIEKITTSSTSNYSINKVINYYINSNINLFISSIEAESIVLCDDGLKFIAQ